ncbi:Plastid ribosomal protein S21 small ribosomal subunit [Ostreococcus lucimarinus CCE9901]|uniref:Plastid ribosomal protein S21 small ribosomal subunit n=2 Tax=Ostreococcus sp. 'lucimarinus' TaxID=242159 RepID=A4S641_OSTLU|nr:Plastid ribosomal protein S21 small ribosomal subunit [Ostreococcus lucimarinus CCE9901]ABO99318.1 Plastid ribosomal protein S21 small ribosomal subunit [Ostreococcus lucimarinus CCE9901]|mmetsp:Transcript_2484/g.9671  ORF Transcript_2484/g.9671 Transcript_2484/m.9671 type:complete len:109 (+) Transcript_2484:42-368(+)|eukprot:XP_001421025.1 Plastid ribosomal protein S21 small ribosomal subunit [Ostreococcus lucimarinus CCE9901]
MAFILGGFSHIFAFKGAFQAEVTVGENENAESAIRRFRKAVMSSGHIQETRRRRYFENKQDILKRKQSTPRNKKGGKPKTAAQAIAEKEAAALNPQGQRAGGRARFNN